MASTSKKWNITEKLRFEKGYREFGTDWERLAKISKVVHSRTPDQARAHAHKGLENMNAEGCSDIQQQHKKPDEAEVEQKSFSGGLEEYGNGDWKGISECLEKHELEDNDRAAEEVFTSNNNYYCQYEGCTERPFLYLVGNGLGTFCAEHKNIGLMNSSHTTLEGKRKRTQPAKKERGQESLVQKILSICQELALRLSNALQQAQNGGQNAGLERQILLAQELGEVLLQQIKELAGNNRMPGCQSKGCLDPAVYAWHELKKGQLCAKHKMNGMVLVIPPVSCSQGDRKWRGFPTSFCHLTDNEQAPSETHISNWANKQCENPGGCSSQPTFNFEGMRRGKFCGKHKLKGMVNAWSRKPCEHPGCSTQPNFNFEGIKGGKFCVKHKLEGMVNVQQMHYRRCEHDGCTTHPTFGLAGGPRDRFCSKHKLEGMVSSHRPCEQDGCSKQPNFNFEGQKGGRFCGQHKEPGMVNNMKQWKTRCGHYGCSKFASFGNFRSSVPSGNERKIMFCSKHRLEGMVNLWKNRCKHDGCGKTASCNFEGQKGGKYCSKHKLEGMVMVVKSYSVCEHAGCAVFPSFNFEGHKKMRFCALHKLDGMVNMRPYKKRYCEHYECPRAAIFNFEGQQKARFCSQHKLEGMIRLKPSMKRLLCEGVGCTIQSSFNFQGHKKLRFCKLHKLEGMVNLKHSRRK